MYWKEQHIVSYSVRDQGNKIAPTSDDFLFPSPHLMIYSIREAFYKGIYEFVIIVVAQGFGTFWLKADFESMGGLDASKIPSPRGDRYSLGIHCQAFTEGSI
jgi:hypothetical protein